MAKHIKLLVQQILKALTDPEVSSSAAVCILLNGIFKVRGEELLPKVSPLVQGMLNAMPAIKDDRTMKGTLNSLRTFSVHHLIPVVEELLTFPLPQAECVSYDRLKVDLINAFLYRNVKSALAVIAKDHQLIVRVIGHLLNIMNNSHMVEDEANASKTSMAVKAPCMIDSFTANLFVFRPRALWLHLYPWKRWKQSSISSIPNLSQQPFWDLEPLSTWGRTALYTD